MLRLFQALWLVGPTLILGGCPMYPSGCESEEDCAYNYVCDQPSGQCVPWNPGPPGPERCTSSSDCSPGLICDAYNRCVEPGGTGGNGGEAGGTTAGEAGATTAGGRG